MRVQELTSADADCAIALWVATGVTRPWNDPAADFQRAVVGATSAVLGVKVDGELIGTVMVGSDGHRGWVYYLAVSPDRQRVGVGSDLMKAAEVWLRAKGAVKIQLMVRHGNDSAFNFYEHLNYVVGDVRVLSKWLDQ